MVEVHKLKVGGPLNELGKIPSLQTAFFSCEKVSVQKPLQLAFGKGVKVSRCLCFKGLRENSGRSYVEDFFFRSWGFHRSQS